MYVPASYHRSNSEMLQLSKLPATDRYLCVLASLCTLSLSLDVD